MRLILLTDLWVRTGISSVLGYSSFYSSQDGEEQAKNEEKGLELLGQVVG